MIRGVHVLIGEYSWLNDSLGDPVKTGVITFKAPLIALALIYLVTGVIAKVLKRWWNTETPTTVSEHIYELLTSPINGAMKISSALLQDAVRAHYRTSTGEFFRKFWLNLIGAAIVSSIIYGIAVALVVLAAGVSVDTIENLYLGDWNQRTSILFGFVKNNIYLNSAVLGMYVLLVMTYAKKSFLEVQFWYLRRAGIEFAIPVGEWDETPKLNIPKPELVEEANKAVKTLLNGSDYIRVKLASGHDTVGPNGYLSEMLKRPNVRWDILLLDPDAAGAERRAQGYLSQRASDPPKLSSVDAYKDSIRASIKHLREIKDQHNQKISVRLYSHTPQWRLFVCSRKAIVSAFGPGQRSDRSPVVIFRDSSTSMFHGYEEMFEDIWSHGSKPEV